MRPLEVLAVAGFRINLNDGSNYWKLVAAIDDIQNTTVTKRTWDEMADEDILDKDAVICYSWGVATVFKAFERLKAAGKMPKIPLLIILAGVPRGLVQCLQVTAAGGWVVPEEVAEVVCEQVNSVPESWPVSNSGPNRVNILVTGIPGNDHVGIQNFPAVHDQVIAVLSAEAMVLQQTA